MPMIHAERHSLAEFLDTLSPEHLTTLAELYKKTGAPLKPRKRLVGLRLEATDVDWSTGEGQEVRGPCMSLILAMVGCTGVLADCEGPGVETLRSRC